MRASIAAVCSVLLAVSHMCNCQLSKLSQAVADCGSDLKLTPEVTTKITDTIGKHLAQLKQDSQLAQVGAAIERDVRNLLNGAGVADKYSAFEACVAKKVS
ncbi:uncharacterized protein LOC100902722 [Galendromus occidentalis]|uniref:Uncharacterized protein LOC100902722 n=1 Tax=Galendromus occidentalis TaxID=34638 RepID=A0AAJ6VW01_9ACAR|nr:uncharacterized protein LOC100902722 [Galendromus occidentalis]